MYGIAVYNPVRSIRVGFRGVDVKNARNMSDKNASHKKTTYYSVYFGAPLTAVLF